LPLDYWLDLYHLWREKRIWLPWKKPKSREERLRAIRQQRRRNNPYMKSLSSGCRDIMAGAIGSGFAHGYGMRRPIVGGSLRWTRHGKIIAEIKDCETLRVRTIEAQLVLEAVEPPLRHRYTTELWQGGKPLRPRKRYVFFHQSFPVDGVIELTLD
jgi:hypothetical protein